MTKANYTMFFIVAITVFYLMNRYVLAGVGTGFALSARRMQLARLVFLTGTLLFFAAEFVQRRYSSDILFGPGMIWLGFLAAAFSLLVIADILALCHVAGRAVLLRYALIAAVPVCAYSFYNASRPPVVKELSFTTEKLSPGAPPVTIVQISDLHLSGKRDIGFLSNVVSRVNALNADAVVITGDLADTDTCANPEMCRLLASIRGKYGVYAVSGNHEYYTGYGRFLSAANSAGIKVLRDESVTAVPGIFLAGVDDPEKKRFEGVKPDLVRALSGNDGSRFTVLLNHQPVRFDEAVRLGADLQLSGHTHWGQFPPVEFLVKLVFKYSFGLYRSGQAAIYTTSGTGVWGPPMRFLSRSEIVRITISPAKVAG